jgi:hypothetical protein
LELDAMPTPLFYPSTIRSAEVRPFTLGGTQISFDLPRESVIESIDIVIEGTVSTAASGGGVNASVEGLPALIQQVQVRGSLAGSGEVLPVSSCSGPDLYELSQFQRGVLTPLVGSLSTTGFFRVVIPVHFRQYFFGDKYSNLRTALPAFAMSSLSVNLTTATQSQVDVGSSPTLAISNAHAWIRVHQCYRDSVPQDFAFIRSFVEVIEDANIQTQSPRVQYFPASSDYALILVRSFGSLNGKQNDASTAPFAVGPNQYLNLYDLNRRQKVGTSFLDLRASNLGHTVDPLVTGNACFVFNRGAESLFQTGEINRAQTSIIAEYNAHASNGVKIRWVYQRIEDPNNILGIPRIASANA